MKNKFFTPIALSLTFITWASATAGRDGEDSDSFDESPRASASAQAGGSASSPQVAAKEETEEALQDGIVASPTAHPEEERSALPGSSSSAPGEEGGEPEGEEPPFTLLQAPPSIEEPLPEPLASTLAGCSTLEELVEVAPSYRKWADTQEWRRCRDQLLHPSRTQSHPGEASGSSTSSSAGASPHPLGYTLTNETVRSHFQEELAQAGLGTLEASEDAHLPLWASHYRTWKGIDEALTTLNKNFEARIREAQRDQFDKMLTESGGEGLAMGMKLSHERYSRLSDDDHHRKPTHDQEKRKRVTDEQLERLTSRERAALQQERIQRAADHQAAEREERKRIEQTWQAHAMPTPPSIPIVAAPSKQEIQQIKSRIEEVPLLPPGSLAAQVFRQDPARSLKGLVDLFFATDIDFGQELVRRGVPSLKDCEELQQVTYIHARREFWAGIRKILVEKFYLHNPLHKRFVNRFKNRLLSNITALLVLRTGMVEKAPTPTQRFFKGLSKLLSLVPMFGAQAGALANIIGTVPEAISHLSDLICATTTTVSTVLDNIADLGDGDEPEDALDRITDHANFDAELNDSALAIMVLYCRGSLWDQAINHKLKAERMADFAVARVLKVMQMRSIKGSSLSAQLSHGIQKVSLHKSGWTNFLEFFGLRDHPDLKIMDSFIARLDKRLSPAVERSNRVYEWHMFGRASQPRNWEEEAPEEK